MATKGRPRNFDRDAALAAATALFWEKGYTATSISDLSNAMGINAPSLYAAFGSKENLYVEALTDYGAVNAPIIWKPLEDAKTAREGFEAFLKISACNQTLAGKPKGCMLTLSAVASEGEVTLGRIVTEARGKILKMLEARLKRGIKEGDLPDSIDVKALARLFLTIQQGMSIQARDGATQKELEAVANAAMAAWP